MPEMRPNDEKFERVSRVVSWEQSTLLPPKSLHVAPVDACNLTCHFCVRSDPEPFQRQPQLSTDRWVSIIDQAAKLGVERIDISGGGEPFLRASTTMSIMRSIKANGLEGIITTNGTLIKDEYLRELVEIAWDNIIFSVDGPNAKTHDFLRNKQGAFETTMETIHKLKEIKESIGQREPNIKINTIIARPNFRHVAEMADLAVELGADRLTFIPITVHSEFGGDLKLTEEDTEELQQFIPSALEKLRKAGIENNLDSYRRVRTLVTGTNRMGEVLQEETPRLGPPCFEPWHTLVVHPDGHIDPCEANTKSSHIGERSLKDVWENDLHLVSFRDNMMRQQLSGICEKCCSAVAAENISAYWTESGKGA